MSRPSKRETFEARNVVIGTGSKPAIPESFDDRVIHNTQYVMNKAELLQREKISIVGSGQSLAEIFLDLLTTSAPERPELEWIARSTLFETLETGKLGEEIFSPSYVTYFNQLPLEVRQESVKKFARSQNGISPETLQSIYAHLYDLTEEEQQQVAIRANLEVKEITYDDRFTISMQHQERGDDRVSVTDAVIAKQLAFPLPFRASSIDSTSCSKHRMLGKSMPTIELNVRSIHRIIFMQPLI
ncbi:SidA/IucD/PvdA family monooxygenase [Exiguobacterium sp. SL14]|nr:SidA/IucD/PvdA family monooxygenase [Exiguobacterium sp. SL14]MCY1691714.1 SidA/IucD/PvdA family monooxygenase [Exiguobacterium sp. SL14]